MIGRLIDKSPNAKILVFTMHEDLIFVSRALEAGAHGYITKSSHPKDFATAIETIRRGGIYLEHATATHLVASKLGRAKTRFDALTARELQVLRLIGQGLSHSEIAERLHLSYKTVANACSQLKSKTNSTTIAELVRIAISLENKEI
jgi:DNA-binding NarL/FixJ family response regulator